MKQKWSNLNPGQKGICAVQAVLIAAAAVVYNFLHVQSPGLPVGILLCVINVFTVLYADELFRWKMRRRVEDPKGLVPSRAELGSRWVGWILCTCVSLAVFAAGAAGL